VCIYTDNSKVSEIYLLKLTNRNEELSGASLFNIAPLLSNTLGPTLHKLLYDFTENVLDLAARIHSLL
jgi:hypothetical protein